MGNVGASEPANRERFHRTIRRQPVDRGLYRPERERGAARRRWIEEGIERVATGSENRSIVRYVRFPVESRGD